MEVLMSKTTMEKFLGPKLHDQGVDFRVWAPNCQSLDVLSIEDSKLFPLKKDSDDYFTGTHPHLKEGSLYKYRINGKDAFPDPTSHYQPEGPHGPSMIIDHRRFQWNDEVWQRKGIFLKGQVLYELHVGTYTPEGTFLALIPQLSELKSLGVTTIEIMPVAECPGRWNWGYDGVNLFAPYHVYGTPDDLKTLINEAHGIGLGVILDVVYNHLGPDGNYLKQYSKDYFTDRYKNEWGESINFDGFNSKYVREFFIANACYWIKEFHFDGLRLDATHSIHDQSQRHVLADLNEQVKEIVENKNILLFAESESQRIELVQKTSNGGYGLDAIWNDDFHHTARVALTGHREAYYKDYTAQPQDFISLIKNGFLYQGQWYSWQKQNRGTFVSDDIDADQFVIFLQNHDQVANSLTGKRVTEDAASYRALTTLFLLAPQTPMLFMGQEFGASSPFLFFVDHNAELTPLIYKGRKEFLAQFQSAGSVLETVDNPGDPQTFERCKLNLDERKTHQQIYQMHRDLLRLRREDEVFSMQDRKAIEGAVLGPQSFILRYKGLETDRLLIINLGNDLEYSPCPQPLLAAPQNIRWKLLWGSEDVRYGGGGIVPANNQDQWYIPGRSSQIFSL
jgi:maltooligosyltrehalose trehalohydrolase